jgi:hypothetical protein
MAAIGASSDSRTAAHQDPVNDKSSTGTSHSSQIRSFASPKRGGMTHLRALRIAPDPDAASIPKRGPSGCRPSAGIAAWQSANYSGWNTAMVLPSGSLNQAERPMPGVVTT